jgi:hypothetical protein
MPMNNALFADNPILPVDIVLAPAWWHHNEGITFDEDFFFHPARRVEAEQQMEKVLYQRWGKFGLGADKEKKLPVIGPVHLAAGYLLSEMLGCKVLYKEDTPPEVICDNRDSLTISAEAAFESPAWKKFTRLIDSLETQYGYVTGDIGFAGVLNIALDLRGQNLFMDMFDRPQEVQQFFDEIFAVTDRMVNFIEKKTGSTSISVNRNVRHLRPAVLVHSQCSHTMISVADYKNYLMKYDLQWSQSHGPYGIHFCGKDPHRYAQAFAELPHLDFLDVGWGGDVACLRGALPGTFLNLRLSPVEIIGQDTNWIADTISRLVAQSARPDLTGVCCINMDEKVADTKITTIFEAVADLKRKHHPNT